MKNSLDKLFGNPVQRIDAIILEMFKKEMDLIEAEGGMENEIRKQKVCLIEDIFKCGKCLSGFSPRYSDYLAPTPFMFDCLYDKTLDELDLIWSELRASLRYYAIKASDNDCDCNWR